MMRSDSLTIPTTLLPLSTTGIAPRSLFASRSMALRASSSGVTVGTSRAMISPAVFMGARLFDRPVGTYPGGDRVDHVGRDHRLRGADPLGCVKTGPHVADDRRADGGKGVVEAGEEGRRHPREEVAGAGGGKRRGRDGVDRGAGAVGDDRVIALEDDDRAGHRGRLLGAGEAVGLDLLRAALEQPAELPGV